MVCLIIIIIKNILSFQVHNIAHKKEWNNAICSNMDGTRDYHTKWSKSDRERQIASDNLYVESKK